MHMAEAQSTQKECEVSQSLLPRCYALGAVCTQTRPTYTGSTKVMARVNVFLLERQTRPSDSSGRPPDTLLTN